MVEDGSANNAGMSEAERIANRTRTKKKQMMYRRHMAKAAAASPNKKDSEKPSSSEQGLSTESKNKIPQQPSKPAVEDEAPLDEKMASQVVDSGSPGDDSKATPTGTKELAGGKLKLATKTEPDDKKNATTTKNSAQKDSKSTPVIPSRRKTGLSMKIAKQRAAFVRSSSAKRVDVSGIMTSIHEAEPKVEKKEVEEKKEALEKKEEGSPTEEADLKDEAEQVEMEHPMDESAHEEMEHPMDESAQEAMEHPMNESGEVAPVEVENQKEEFETPTEVQQPVEENVEDEHVGEAGVVEDEQVGEAAEEVETSFYDDPPLEEMEDSEASFDMRSDHVDETTPVGQTQEKPQEVDPEWDAANVVFQAGQMKNNKPNDGLEMFETDSWAKTSASFSHMPGAHPDIDEFARKLMQVDENGNEEETKEPTIAMLRRTNAEEEKKERESSQDEADLNGGGAWVVQDQDDKKEQETAQAQNSAEQNGDSAWDVSNQEFQGAVPASRSAENGAPDMFDTSSWANSDVAFSDVSLSKLMHHPDIEAKSAEVGHQDESNALIGKIPEDEEYAPEESADKEDEENSDFKDGEPLIAEQGDDGHGGSEAGTTLSMQERIEMYTAPNEKDDASSDADDDNHDEEEVSQGVEEVAYTYSAEMSEEDVDEAGEEVAEASEEQTEEITTPTVEAEIPTFDAAANAAQIAERGQILEADDCHYISDDEDDEDDEHDGSTTEGGSNAVGSTNDSVVSSLAGENFLSGASVDGMSLASSVGGQAPIKRSEGAPPRIPPGGMAPPPPPPPGEKKSKKSKSGSKGGGRRSEEKVGGSGKSTDKLESVDEISSNEDGGLSTDGDDEIEEPPKVKREKVPEEEPKLFSTPPKAKNPKSPEKALSPSSGEAIIVDQKMAEKVALASSAAAVKFEQRLKLEGERSPLAQNQASEDETEKHATSVRSPERMGGSPNDSILSARSPAGGGSGLELVGGAFSSWKESDFERKEKFSKNTRSTENQPLESLPESEPDHDSGIEQELSQNVNEPTSPLAWFIKVVLESDAEVSDSPEDLPVIARLLLEDDSNFNKMCAFMANTINEASVELDMSTFDERTLNTIETMKSTDSTVDSTNKVPFLRPMVLSEESRKLSSPVIAANFVSFLFLASKLSSTISPFGEENPFLADIVGFSLQAVGGNKSSPNNPNAGATPQQLIFDHPSGSAEIIIEFVHEACTTSQRRVAQESGAQPDPPISPERPSVSESYAATPATNNKTKKVNRLLVVPDSHPSPFESSVWSAPRIIAVVLSFLGDPVAVCRTKMVSRFCNRIISENEHMLMQQAVRIGGLSMNVRPAFWMWVTLQKCGNSDQVQPAVDDLRELEQKGRMGKWHSVIDRDVARSFGNMPPHKTGARLRTDSIVKALVTWGKNRIMKRGVKGGGDPVRTPELGPKPDRKQKETQRRSSISSPPWECSGDNDSVESEASQTPTETVSDWGGVSPVGSFAGSHSGFTDSEMMKVRATKSATGQDVLPTEELALSGNSLSNDMKVDLQNKLRFILHSLAASHEDVGYCQGMDYVVAHLLRILQDTVRWHAMQGTLPAAIVSASKLPDMSKLQEEGPVRVAEEIDKNVVVEEVVFRVMDTFFTTYNLRHMYWPELRCLKTCCRVFERLIQIKLPVLADHFEHHELNVGLFALGWFQTLFLYLPSMPSATVCHMWDIWLVERSFKIFFRVGTAILFLSQPILLNHELEGMMTYLNTIPDATLLKPDILIACALNIKVTNRLLQELEEEVTRES